MNLAELPSIASQQQIQGTHEGEIKVFRNADSTGAEAFMWKLDNGIGMWEKIGDVMMPA